MKTCYSKCCCGFEIFQKNIIKNTHWKVPYYHKNTPYTIFLSSIESKENNESNLILNIEGATEHSCLENCSRRKYKIFKLYYCNFLITK